MFLKSRKQYPVIVLLGFVLCLKNLTGMLPHCVPLLSSKPTTPMEQTSHLFSPEFLKLSPVEIVSNSIPLTIAMVEDAYKVGVFPWGCDEESPSKEADWHFPNERGVLLLKNLHIPRRLAQFMRNHPEYTVTFDTSFLQVMKGCAETSCREEGVNLSRNEHTWISPQYFKVWAELFALGKAHSVEVWNQDQLVAGLYGTFIQGVFFGESAFALGDKQKETMKIAFVKLAERLKAKGHIFMDCQTESDWTKRLGASVVSKLKFLELLSAQQKKKLSF